MTDKEIEKLREAMGSLPVDIIALERSHPTPPEQRIVEAMRLIGEVHLLPAELLTITRWSQW